MWVYRQRRERRALVVLASLLLALFLAAPSPRSEWAHPVALAGLSVPARAPADLACVACSAARHGVCAARLTAPVSAVPRVLLTASRPALPDAPSDERYLYLANRMLLC